MSPTSKGKKGGERRPPPTATFPPLAWEREENVISKTMPGTPAPAISHARKSRSLAASPPPLDEASARVVLHERFTAAGYHLRADHAFRAAGVVATLDAYDPGKKVGFAYVASHDADVVTDIGPAEEEVFANLHAAKRVHVLVVHDRDVAGAPELRKIADAFLATLRAK